MTYNPDKSIQYPERAISMSEKSNSSIPNNCNHPSKLSNSNIPTNLNSSNNSNKLSNSSVPSNLNNSNKLTNSNIPNNSNGSNKLNSSNSSSSLVSENAEMIDLMQKIKGGIEGVSKNIIAGNASSKNSEAKIIALETEVSKIQDNSLKSTTSLQTTNKTINTLGTKLVEGINFLESSNKSNTKEIKNSIKASEEKFNQSFGITVLKNKISAATLFKLMFILLLINSLALMFIVFTK